MICRLTLPFEVMTDQSYPGDAKSENCKSVATPTMEDLQTSPHGVSKTLATLRKVFSFPGLLGTILILEAWSTLALYPHDPDVWWHVVVGSRILNTHSWPSADPYSFTAHGNPWIAYEWLGEVVMALAERAGGLAGLAALRIGIAAILGLLLYYYAHLRCRNSKAAFAATALMFWLSYGFFWMRPQLIGYVFLLLVLIFVERYRQGQQKSLWILPFVFLLWVNTHGSFVLGFLVLGVYWVGGLWNWELGHLRMDRWSPGQRRHLSLIILLSEVALLLTPYGTQLATYPLEMLFSQPLVFSNIAEWRPIGFGEIWGKEVLVLFLLLFVGLAVLRPVYRVEEFILLFFAISTCCIHRRMFVVFALIVTPLLASMLARWTPPYKPNEDHYVLNACLMGLAVAGMIWFFPSRKKIECSVNQVYPHSAVQYIRDHPDLNPMFNEDNWGGYLIWSLGAPHKVFIDGRADLYEHAGVYSDYISMMEVAPQTMFLLRKYSIRSCLLMRGAPLGTLLASLPDWHRVHTDKLAVLYVHESVPSTAPKETAGLARLHSRFRNERPDPAKHPKCFLR